MVTDVPADAVQFIQNDDVQVTPYARWYQFAVSFNSAREPLRDPRVRRALNIAIDRSELVAKALHGQGSPASGPIWPRYWAFDESVPDYNYDPSFALSLLAEAGHAQRTESSDPARPPARLRFTCLVAEGFSIQERIALVVQKQLYSIGVDMEIDIVPGEELEAHAESGNFDAILLDMISGPTPGRAYMFWASASRFKGMNVFGYENPEAERLFDTIRTTVNEAAVRSATGRLQRTLLEDPPALFLAWNQRARAIRRDLVIPEDDGDPMRTIAQWKVRQQLQVASQ
jgi:peptide/nickel transport system substrate-binding protein